MSLIFPQGFTLGGAPVLNKFIKVKGTFETATRATTSCPPTILINIHYFTIDNLAHFVVAKEVLSEYYTDDNRLQIINMPLDVAYTEAAAKWNTDVTKLVAGLSDYQHVVVFITTHSDPTSGDLWIGQDEDNNPCAASVTYVSTGLFYYFILILTMNSIVA